MPQTLPAGFGESSVRSSWCRLSRQDPNPSPTPAVPVGIPPAPYRVTRGFSFPQLLQLPLPPPAPVGASAGATEVDLPGDEEKGAEGGHCGHQGQRQVPEGAGRTHAAPALCGRGGAVSPPPAASSGGAPAPAVPAFNVTSALKGAAPGRAWWKVVIRDRERERRRKEGMVGCVDGWTEREGELER